MRFYVLPFAIVALCAAIEDARAQGPTPDASTVTEGAPEKKKRGRPTPPRQLDASRPNLVVSGRVPGSLERRSNLLELRVEIDETGVVDLSTLRVTGAGATDNRGEIIRWLEAAKFEPARDADGNPVRAEFRMRMSVGGA